MISVLKKLEDGSHLIELKNDSIRVIVSSFGCTITNIFVKDRMGNVQDVVLGFSDISDYALRDGSYLGACVGRVANRIEKGQFDLNHNTYSLPINNGPNCLHGGVEGFSYQIFDYEIRSDSVWFHYVSKAGEEGFPGNLDVYIVFSLVDSALKIEYKASCDEDTIVNLTNHSYFNLNGSTSYVGNHELQVCADQYGCVDSDGLFTGEVRNVSDSCFDFRSFKNLDACFHALNDQIVIAKGLDHAFLFNCDTNQVALYSPRTGIEMVVSTSYPCAQIYSANYLNGALAKDGLCMREKDAICVETQFLPDSIHKEKSPKVILRKEDLYDEWTVYKFGLRDESK